MELKASLEPPKFASVEDERLYRKQRLAGAFRLFARFGFDEGVAGHITVRDPERPDHFWVNPFGQYFGTIRASDLILVNHQGQVVQGNGIVNAAAFAIHAAVHRARPDVVAAAHTHSVYGKAWSALGRLLDPITQDSCIFYNDHALMTDYTGVVLDPEEGRRIAEQLGFDEGYHPSESRTPDGGSKRRRSGLLVRDNGAHLRGAADGRSGWSAQAHRATLCRAYP